MPKRCSVCTHDRRDEIDRDLMAGDSYRTLAARYHLSASALCRHTKHLARYLEARQHRVALDCIREYLRILSLQDKFRGRLP